MPTPNDYVYVAGLLDGEGYFSPVDSGRIRCDMTAPEVVKWLADTFGGSLNGPFQYATNNLPVWKWTLSRLKDREILLHAIIPHLRVKRASAEAMLRLVEHSLYDRPGRNWSGHGESPPVWVAWRARRAELQQAMKEARCVSSR